MTDARKQRDRQYVENQCSAKGDGWTYDSGAARCVYYKEAPCRAQGGRWNHKTMECDGLPPPLPPMTGEVEPSYEPGQPGMPVEAIPSAPPLPEPSAPPLPPLDADVEVKGVPMMYPPTQEQARMPLDKRGKCQPGYHRHADTCRSASGATYDKGEALRCKPGYRQHDPYCRYGRAPWVRKGGHYVQLQPDGTSYAPPTGRTYPSGGTRKKRRKSTKRKSTKRKSKRKSTKRKSTKRTTRKRPSKKKTYKKCPTGKRRNAKTGRCQ